MRLEITLSDAVAEDVRKLVSIEEGREGNWTRVDEMLDKLRYRVTDLVMGAVMKEVREESQLTRIK